jgi:tRNA-dihydrouridine synthase
MKPLSKSLTYILSAVKTVTVARGGMNQIWILKNSKDLLEDGRSSSSSLVEITKEHKTDL